MSGGKDHLVRIDALTLAEQVAEALAAVAGFPPGQLLGKRAARDSGHGGVEEAQASEVKHHFGDATGKEDADGGMMDGPIGKDAHQPRCVLIDGHPVVDRGAWKASGVGDGGDVE